MPLYRVGRDIPEVLAWSLRVDGVIFNGTAVRTSARTRGTIQVRGKYQLDDNDTIKVLRFK